MCLHLDPAAQLGLGPSHGCSQSWERGGNGGEARSRKDLVPALEQHCCAEAAEGQGQWRIHALPRARGLVPLGRGNEELALSLEGAEGEEGQEGTCRLWDLLSQGHQDPRREMA